MKRHITILVLLLSLLTGVAAWRAARTQAAPVAATIRVPEDRPTIQAAINAASAGDTVDVKAGTYNTNDFTVVVDKAITVKCRTGTGDDCILQGSGGPGIDTVIQLYGENVVSVLDGFTVRDGTGTGSFPLPILEDVAGGIHISNGARPVIRNCKIVENFSPATAGVSVRDASPTFSNCLIGGNLGTGMRVAGTSNVTINGCTFRGNSDSGLALGVGSIRTGLTVRGQSTASISNSRFENNDGAGLDLFTRYDDSKPSAFVTGSVFMGNRKAGVDVGSSDTLSMTNCAVLFNTRKDGAGGVVSFFMKKLSLTNSLVVGNKVTTPDELTASAVQALITNEVNVTNCTISGHAVSTHPTMYLATTKPSRVTNTILWGNTSTKDIFSLNQNVTVNNCDTQNGLEGIVDGGGNLSTNPLFVRNALTNGATDAGDLRLQNTSPVKDRGTLTGVDLNAFVKDTSGNPLDYALAPRLSCDYLIDMGAYENQTLSGSIFAVGTPTANGPVGASYTGSVAATPAAPAGFSYRYSLANGTSLPGGLLLNTGTGAITGTPTASGVFNFDIRVELLNPSNNPTACSDTQTRSLNISCPSFTVGTPTATGALGVAYSSSAAATPAAPSGFKYQYSVTSGQLPPGLALDAATGALTGMPAASGNFSFDLQAELLTTSDAATGCSNTQTRTINVTCISNVVVANLNDSGAGSLREAIATACAGSTITFAPGLSGTLTLTSGDLIVTRSLTIQGPGAQLITLSGNQQWRIFTVRNATPTSFSLSGLSLRQGNGQSTAPGTVGLAGAIYYRGTAGDALTLADVTIANNSSEFGGGVYFNGSNVTLNVLRSTIAGNRSAITGGGLELEGGGSTVNLVRSTIAGNTAGGRSNGGGGIDLRMSGTLNIVNCTIAGNQAAAGRGGGIGNSINGVLTVNLVNSTLTGNQGGGLQLIAGQQSAYVRNSLLALNDGGDVLLNGATFTSNGYNLFGTGVPAGAVQPTDQVGVNPLLELDANGKPLLADNGGPTQTIRLLPGSPAIDKGAAATDPSTNQPLTTDQRGQTRPSDYPAINNAVSGNGSDIGAFEVQCAGLTLGALPGGTAGVAYNQSLTPGGGFAPYSIALSGGTLPPGLTINGNSLSGLPTATGTFNFTLQVTDAYGCTGSRSYTVAFACAGVTVIPASLPGGTVGTAYNQTVGTSPTGAFNFAVTSGALPMGLMLNAANGAITGTPAQSGSFSFTITATGADCAGSRSYTVVIGCPTITLAALGNATVGTNYAGSVAASPSGAYSYSLLTGSLPAGLTLNPTNGALTGIPAAAGTYSFTIKAQAANGCSGQQTYSLTVGCPAVTVNPASLPNPTAGAAYSQTLSAAPAGGNYSYAVSSGGLPAGLNLNSATGAISGTTTATGTFNFRITATGFGGCTGSRDYSFVIGGGACPTITPADLPGGQPGQLYNQAVTASPAGSYSYAVTSGSLPPGLTLFGSFGLIYGFPTTAGTFSFTVTATSLGDSSNCTGGKAYSLQIGGAASRSLVFGDFDGDGKADLSVWRGATGQWLTLNSGDGKLKTEAWGTSAAPYFDVMTPGDYDGDGKMDLAVFRKSTGEWLIKRSSDGAVTAKLWGLGTDTPVPGDYDGDGKTDIAVWRGADTNWYIVRSSDEQVQTVSWGTSKAPYNDVPVAADFDGDGKTDIAVFRQANGRWYIRQSSDGAVVNKAWGLGTDVPVAADYDGDGRADIAVWRGSESNWYIIRSSDGAVQSLSLGSSAPGDVPAPTDYDGDGKADPAIWRAGTGSWAVKTSLNGSLVSSLLGRSGDTPVAMKGN